MDKDVTKIRHEKKRAFLKAYADTGRVTTAAKKAGVERTTHYTWMRGEGLQADLYRAEFAELKELVCGSVEDEIYRRAIKGTRKSVFHQGKKCGFIREYSDTLLIFFAKALMPGMYRDNTIEHPPSTQVPGAVVDAAAIRRVYQDDPKYMEYLRSGVGEGNGQPGDLRNGRQQGPLEDGGPSGNGRPGPDGNGEGK